MGAIDWSNMNPQGEITLVGANDYATIRLASGDEITVMGDGRMVAYVKHDEVDGEFGFTQDLPNLIDAVCMAQVM